MPSLAKIWRAGFSRLGLRRRRRELRVSIERAQLERPALLTALGEAAWRAGVVKSEFSLTSSELEEKSRMLATARDRLERSAVRRSRAEEDQHTAEREYTQRLESARAPLSEAQMEYRRLRKRQQRLEGEHTRLQRSLPVLRESAALLEARIAELEGSGDEGRDQLARLSGDLERRRSDAVEVERRLADLGETELASLGERVEAARRQLDMLGEELESLKGEADEVLHRGRTQRETLAEEAHVRERDARAIEDEIEPLLFQLGEELNGRRLLHESLNEHYVALDDQLTRMRGLHTALGHTEADLRALDVGAVHWFWVLAICAGLVLAGATTLLTLVLLR